MRHFVLAIIGLGLVACDQNQGMSGAPGSPQSQLARTASVGLLADAQYCDCAPEDDRHHRASLWKLEEAAETFNRERVDFSIHLGDLIDRDAASIVPALGALARLDSALLHVLGNHDFHVAEVDRESIPGRMGMETRYHHRTKGLWRFVFLDGTDLSLFATAPGSARRAETDAMRDSLRAGGERGIDWNGGIGRDQLEWLGETLDDARARGQRVALFSHFPIYPETLHNLWNDQAVLALLDRYPNVVAHLSGHDHGGRSEERQGVLHVGMEGIVQTRGQNAYAIATFGVDALEIQGSGRVASQTLPFPDRAPSVRERRQRRSQRATR